MLLGLDKSALDGTLNWPLARERGIRWTTLRVSGRTPDADYALDRVLAKAMNIPFLPYHWYVPRTDPIAQAEKFLDHVVGADLPPMLDLEDYSSARAYRGIADKELHAWLDMVQNATGQLPVIYTSPSYIQSYLQKATWISEYPLMIAHWKAAAPLIPLPWTPDKVIAWQFVDGADAKFYGFNQSKGCALAVWMNTKLPIQPWSINAQT
jgi:lysozyme